eukprot:832769-Prorocentrum_lima.AAC.1
MVPPNANHLNNKCVTILDEAVRSDNTCQNLQQMTGHAVFTSQSMQNKRRSYNKSLEHSEYARKGCVVAFHNAC